MPVLPDARSGHFLLDERSAHCLQSADVSSSGRQNMNSAPRMISATLAKNRFGELIMRVFTTGEPVIIEKSGIPIVTVLPISGVAPQVPGATNATCTEPSLPKEQDNPGE